MAISKKTFGRVSGISGLALLSYLVSFVVANDAFIGDLESDFFRLSMSFDGKKTEKRQKYLNLSGIGLQKSTI
jgi:hypothetical protein